MTAPFVALGDVHAFAVYLILAAAVLAESLLLIGAFVPTLTLLLTAGALARAEHLDLLLVIAVAAGAVITGDFLAHRTGRLLGSRLRTAGIGRRIPAGAWQRAEGVMSRRGGQALLVTRFIPVVRTLTPHLAGATHLPYRRIAPYSTVAAPLWATAEAGAGYTAATTLQHALAIGAPALAALLIAAAAVALLWRRIHSRRSAAHPSPSVQVARSPSADSSTAAHHAVQSRGAS